MAGGGMAGGGAVKLVCHGPVSGQAATERLGARAWRATQMQMVSA
jgi:hypothetical protein